MRLIFAFCLFASPAFAEVCPSVDDQSARLADIYAALETSETEADARALSEELWSIWLNAPDSRAQRLLDLGMRKRSGFDLLGSRDTLDELVEYCPEYAEGYNQRAFSSFLRRDYNAALVDLDVVLEIEPRHLGALTGKGLTLLGMGRDDEAHDVLREALKLNPWLSERELIPGTDI